MYKIKKFYDLKLLLISLFFSFTLGLYAPLEMYLTNINECWFTFSLIWWIPLLMFLTLFSFLYICGLIIRTKKLYKIYTGILFGLSSCFYLQANFIKLDIGVMNGANIDWSLYHYRICKDLFVWIIVILCVIFCFLWKNDVFMKLAAYIAAFLSLVQLITLITLFGKEMFNGDLFRENRGYFDSDKALYEVGSEDNVIIFMLDMFDDSYFKEILKTEPNIADNLDGFTYFNNNTGLYSATSYSVLSLYTGKIFHNEMIPKQWKEVQSKKRLYLDEVVDSGYKLSFYTDHIGALPDRFSKLLVNNINTTLKISNNVEFIKLLYQLVDCKYFPDYFKTFAWMKGTEFDKLKKYISEDNPYQNDNRFFRDGLNINGVTVKEGIKEYKFIHTTGAHFPYCIDKNGLDVEEDTVGAVECARGSLQIVQDYMEDLKKQNVYNNSTIIIMADHGYYRAGVLSNPVFLVKPRNSQGKMTINNSPISQAYFAATIVDLIRHGNKNDYGISAFDVPENMQADRLFYQYYLDDFEDGRYRLIEYQADNTSNDTSLFKLTDVEYTFKGEKIQHSKYCKSCQEGGQVLYDYEVPRLVHEMGSNYPK